MTKIALVGCGLVGGSWGLVFARAGYEVTLYDPSPASLQAALDFVRGAAPALAAQGLLNGETPETILSRLKPASSLAEAVSGADYIQESAPERLPIKQALYKELANLVKPDAIIASSTSGFPASSFTGEIEGRERCVVAHPINPPHLIPLVEIIPAPWTAPAVVERTDALMRAVGQVPIRLNREIAGFVVNRLQSAVLAEAFRLVEDGVVSATDVDAAMSEGLGLRWFFMGPFETIDLNAQGGVADYCAKLGPMYYDLAKEQADPRPWSEALVATVEKQRRAKTPADGLDARKAWRDRCLAALVTAKRKVLKENA
ncbi:3-hydroxyacyl-CoA dehydrogenase NAD-binding protein [Ancylobacter novellus DSM 506]|uniref:L-gulonate 3-dehydrogenase n=1 Tax=Ancylobacter novellus (strain ATCC 8093 / DSM 506 / JCM 20403 / CCM 1077 / IAM 12100 / NBRC 12443 / NCIMB 10456) TaxID=639283 RepID=D7A0N0_ANCN5|nr:3-hydroxyacyl-CoA dehydrogenase [Ancylobacter novellus]ADH91351.1 3-hydroxyacyl-CoA dehydrogenase NAD-binding protein [Ancylobacter novellus DSM 506]